MENTIQPPKAFPSIGQTLALLGIFFLFSLGISTVLAPFLGTAPGDMPTWFLLVGTAIPTGATVWIAQVWRGGGDLWLRAVPLPRYVLAVLFGMAVAGIGSVVVEVTGVPDLLKDYLDQFLTRPDIFSFIAIVVAAPVLEELLFRSVILGGFLQRYSPGWAIAGSALIFGVFHMNPAQAVGAFLIGLALGYIFWKAKSVWPCIALHAVNNGLGYWGLMDEDLKDLTMREWLGGGPALVGFTVGCLAVAAVGYWRMRAWNNGEEDLLS